MKTYYLSLVASVACASSLAVTSTPTGFTDDFDAALKSSAVSSRPVVAVFSGSDWCGWCTKLEKEVFAQEDFLKDATNRYALVFVDSPRDKSLLSATAVKRNPELVKKYAIEGFPTVLVLDAQGAVLGKTGYRRGGGAAYVKHLDGIVANGPLVAKYLKPYRDEFEKLTSEFQAEAEKLFKTVCRTDKAEIDAAKGKLKALAPEYRKKAKAIRKRFRAETIPDEISAEKEELLREMKSFIRGMRLLVEEKPKSGEGDDESAVDRPSLPDGKWHGIASAKAWAESVQTNAAVPSAWRYFTEQHRPYVRRQLAIPADDPFAAEATALADEIARTLWTPFNTMNKTYVLRKDCERMQALRDRGCSNLTVRALAAMADYSQHMAKRGAISQKGPESEPYRVMARELTERGTPLLRKLYADVIGSIADHGAVTKAFLDDLKAHPADLRVVYNFIGSPAEAKEYDPWFGHIAEAEAEDRAAWKARGGGYASEVTEEGWKGFNEHLAKARVAGEKAYQLHPELPESSYVMLHIVAPQCASGETDLWFSRVLEREIDNRKAWNTYVVFHVLPRWGGSVAGLYRLSDALWTIDRADLRYMRYKSVQLLVTADMESANDGSFFRDPSVRERYLSACSRVVDGEGVDDEVAMKARKGIVDRYWGAGEYEAAGKAYQDLIASAPYRFKSWAFGWGEVHDVVLPALSGPHVGKLVEFERYYQQHLAKEKKPSEEVRTEARRLIRPLVSELESLAPAEKRLVYLRKGQLGVEASAVTDDVWHELPVEEGFPGWTLTPNARDYWKYADGAYRLARAAMTIDWASPLPADYELEMDVSLERYVKVCLDQRVPRHPGNEDFGCPYVTVTRAGNAKRGWKARIELHSGLWNWETRKKRQLSAEIPLKDFGLRHKILIAVRQGEVTVSIDGEKAMETGDLFKRHFAVPRDGSKIKIGGQMLEIYGLRYRRL